MMQPIQEPHTTFGMSLLKRAIRIFVTYNVILLCLVGTVFVIGVMGAAVTAGASETGRSYNYIYGEGTNEFLSLSVSGVIVGGSQGADSFSSLFAEGYAYGYDIKDRLYEAAKDDTIKGIVLEIDSPGGTIFGAKAIADGVKYYREETKKPVFAHIEGTGASGGYWAAISADKVYADYGSAVGSIGVIMGPFEYYDKVIATDGGLLGGGVITQNGVESTYLTAGKSKDVGNPYRRLTPAETQSLQQTVNNEYDGFVKYVSERRAIPDATIRNSIGALIYDPKSAQDLKLIDATGSRQDTYDALAKAGRHGDDYTIIREYAEPGFLGSILGAFTRQKQPEAASKFDTCKLTQVSLAYHGDVSRWCSKP